jgi:cell division protein FtsI/penicillin-binding protein 2
MPAFNDNLFKQIRTIWAEAVFALIFLALLALVFRIGYINVVHRDSLIRRATRQHTGFRPALAQRGSIYDRRGRILAGSCLADSLFADPAILRDKEHSAELLQTIIGHPAGDILHRLSDDPDSRFVWLARNMPPEQVETFTGLARDDRYGLGILNEPRREYPKGTLAGHVLGAVQMGEQGLKGLEGLELYYDELLASQNGFEKFIRDAAGRKIWLLPQDYRPPRNGNNVILTIDVVIQEFTERILEQTCEKYKAKSGCAVVMEPTTGEILAMACWPRIDPNRFNEHPADQRRNRVITDPFEPGSIFKPFVAVAALKHRVVNWQETIFCHNGEYTTLAGRRLHDHHGMGDLTFAQIVIKSSNIGMGILGERLGNDRLYDAMTSFGFGRRTGIDLRGESPGIVRPLAVWDNYSTTSVTMGHEVGATPIQLITAFSALANDGVILQPRLMRAVLDENGVVLRDNSRPREVARAIEREFAQAMVRQVLAQVITEGTGTKAKIPGYRVFGKTGTAQIAEKGRYKQDAFIASFLGGAPATAPKVTALVTIFEPDRRIGHFGGTVAAPAVKEILENTLKYLDVQPVENEDAAEQTSEAGSTD